MLKIISASALLLACLSPLHAETLLLDAIAEEPANTAQGMLRPQSGTSMAQVVQRFGPASQELPAVGEPPITRWEYSHFTVYFEHNIVIKTVVKR